MYIFTSYALNLFWIQKKIYWLNVNTASMYLFNHYIYVDGVE